MFDKLFSWTRKKEEPRPDVVLGRYSDNNKNVEKTNRWDEADALFKEKNYVKSIDAFFDYLRDDANGNVITERKGEVLNFTIYQGSKVVKGYCDDKRLYAEVNLARMPQASIPVMRRLL
jgi:tRNA uridine 5-carbamoylmethylation protein Kti12